jgi:hypothetical protein
MRNLVSENPKRAGKKKKGSLKIPYDRNPTYRGSKNKKRFLMKDELRNPYSTRNK